MSRPVKRVQLRLAISALLLALVVLTGLGYTERVLELSGLGSLEKTNETYLDEAFNRSLKLFAVLSAVKVGLAVMEGSEAGFSFFADVSLEIGDFFQAAYDYVDIAWRTVLMGGVILQCMRYFLQSADLLDQWFLMLALIFIWTMLMVRWFLPKLPKTGRVVRDVGLLMTILAVVFYLVLPLSIGGGRFLSSKITEPSLSGAEQELSQIERHLSVDLDLKEGWVSGASGIKDKITYMWTYLKIKATDLVVLLLTVIAVYLFDCVVFPLALFLFLLWSTRVFARYLFGLKKTQNFKEDLEAILEKFHTRRELA